MIDSQAVRDLVATWVSAMGRAEAGHGVLFSFAWKGFASWAAPRLQVAVGVLCASKEARDAFSQQMMQECPGSYANGSVRYPLQRYRL